MHDHEITSLSTQLNNTTQNGGFVDIWGKSAGRRWRRSGGGCGNTIYRLWELEIYSADVQNAGEPLM
jgi:hypothetical protein|nr:MAG TPA: hypothetical protein [Caudoviricetes sp.]